jgi:phage shock protein E
LLPGCLFLYNLEKRRRKKMNKKSLPSVLAALVFVLTLSACGSSRPASNDSGSVKGDPYTVINAEKAKSMIDAGNVTIVDVRTPDEFAEKHIPDAINIPVESIGTEKPDGLPDLDAVILVYCRTGIRAANASGKLADIGYTQIYDMGGIVDWPYDTVAG